MREYPERGLEPPERPEPPQCAGCLGEITEEDKDPWEFGRDLIHDDEECAWAYIRRKYAYSEIFESYGATKKRNAAL